MCCRTGGTLPAGARVVTYVSRGFELMRGFDVFMCAAKRIAEDVPEAVFVVVGSDRVCYGGEQRLIAHKTFREHVVAEGGYDLSRFYFTGRVSEPDLASILSRSDLHVYLTVPFVPSWSLLNAMSCSCVVLASDQACVREYVTDGHNGLLCDFFDVEGIAQRAVHVLRDPAAHAALGEEAAGDSASALFAGRVPAADQAVLRGGGGGARTERAGGAARAEGDAEGEKTKGQ